MATFFHDWAEKTGQPHMTMISMGFKTLQACMDGRLEEAVNLSQKIMDLANDSEFALAAQAIQLTFCLRPISHLGVVDSIINEDFVETIPGHFAKAMVLSYLGRNNEAYVILDQLSQNLEENPVLANFAGGYLFIMSFETALMCGHKKMIEMVIERVFDRFKNIDQKTTGVFYTTIIPRHLGAGAAILGRYDEAKTYYQKAIDIAKDMRFRPELALSRFQLAELILEHFPNEKEDALAHLNFAIDEFKEMKMQPSLEKAQALKDSL